MSQIAFAFRRSPAVRFEAASIVIRAVRAVGRTLVTWAERDRQRRELRELDSATLRDVGLSREQVDFEAGKPFWRP